MVNIFALSKRELQLFVKGKCRHHHRYCEHPNCFIVEQSYIPKVAFLDIETSNLAADYGIVISVAILDDATDEIYADTITQNDIKKGIYDKRLVENAIKQLLKYDVIITYNGEKFDIPFLRARALIHKIEFPVYGQIQHRDMYQLVKRKFRIHSKKLINLCKIMGIEDKTAIEPTCWIQAMTGNKEALEKIKQHNIGDVIALKKVYYEVQKYGANTRRSL